MPKRRFCEQEDSHDRERRDARRAARANVPRSRTPPAQRRRVRGARDPPWRRAARSRPCRRTAIQRRSRALERRSSSTWLAAPIQAERASNAISGRSGEDVDGRGGQERARQRPDHRVRSDLVHAKVPVPAKRHEHGVEIRRERTQDCGARRSRAPARRAGESSVRTPIRVRPNATCDTGSIW